jgi:hypothetical protein
MRSAVGKDGDRCEEQPDGDRAGDAERQTAGDGELADWPWLAASRDAVDPHHPPFPLW